MAGARTWILDQLDAERSRWMLWLPVAMGLGIAVYFELPSEPALWLGPALAAAAFVLVFFTRSGSLARALAIGLVAASAGLGLVTWRTAMLAAPTLSRPLFSINVEGRIADIQRLPGGVRVVLEAVRLKGHGAPPLEMTPVRLRVSLGKGAPPLHVGDRLLVLANLSPPAGPAAPGAFDFQRVAWYQQLGAVGYALAPATVIEHGRPDGIVRSIDALRADVTQRILQALPGPEGGVAAALLTGEQTAVDKDITQAMRDSGLAHILSISGLHIVFVVALVMGLVRYAIALVPPLALRIDAKKTAAVIALLAALFYTALAGAPVPAQRSCAMAGFALLAVLLDRTALSLRLVAWSAVIVLAAAPESLTGASFQMSFAAVIGLIAAWEAGAGWRRRLHARADLSSHRWFWRLAAGFGASLATTLIASIATGAFAAYHFNRLSLLGVVANLLGVPLTGFWIMPWGLLAMLLMPVGLERFALVPMGWGVDGLDAIAFHVAGLAAGRHAGAVAARRQLVAADRGRPVALPVAPSLAARGTAGGRGRPAAEPAAAARPPDERGRPRAWPARRAGRGACRLGPHRSLRCATPGRGAAARKAPSDGPLAPTRRRPASVVTPASAAGARGRGASPW